MRKKILEKNHEINDEALDKYLYAIGASINEINQQVEEVY